MDPSHALVVVDDPEKAREVLKTLSEESWAAWDLEGDNLGWANGKLSIASVRTSDGHTYIIDALAQGVLEVFKPYMEDDRKPKAMFDCR